MKETNQSTCESPVEATCESPVEATRESPVEATCEIPVKAACETPVKATCETSVKATRETPVKAACETPVKAACETPVEATCETPVEATCETPLKAACETPVKTACENPVKAACETPVKAACETPVKATCETPVKATCETPVKAACETPVKATCATPVKAACETPVKAACESPVKATCETPVKAACETPVKATCATPVKAACETPVKAACETPVKATCETPVKATCETPVKAACETPVKATCETPVRATCETSVKATCETPVKATCETAAKATCETPVKATEKGEKEGEKEEADGGDVLECPDGGWGWFVCFAGFMINFSVVGQVASNGIIILGLIELFEETNSKTTMVGSLFMGIGMCVGPFVLLLMMFDASHRQVIMLGGFLSAVSTFASAFAWRVEVLYLTHGILSGTFVGISMFAGNTIVCLYFKRKRSLAVGIASSGAGCGAFLLNYLIERSMSFYGMRGTFILLSGLNLNLIAFGALCRPLLNNKLNSGNLKETNLKVAETPRTKSDTEFKPDEKRTENRDETNIAINGVSVHTDRSKNSQATISMKCKFFTKCCYLRHTIFDSEVMKNSTMQLLLIVYLFWATAEVMLLSLPSKITRVGLTRAQSSLIMSIYGAVFAFAQFLVGILANVLHIPTTYLLMFSMFGMSAITVAFTFCYSFTTFTLCGSLFAVCHGFSSALRVVLVASIVGQKNVTKGYSPLCLLIGLAYIIYQIIAGSLYDATNYFDTIFLFSSATLLMACIMSTGMIYFQRKKKFCE